MKVLKYKENVFYKDKDTISYPKNIPMAGFVSENTVPKLMDYESKYVGKGIWVEEKREYKLSFLGRIRILFYQTEYDFLATKFPEKNIVMDENTLNYKLSLIKSNA